MITMKDIIREGNPTLRAVAEEVPVPITEEDRQLGEDMLTFLKKVVKIQSKPKNYNYVVALV